MDGWWIGEIACLLIGSAGGWIAAMRVARAQADRARLIARMAVDRWQGM